MASVRVGRLGGADVRLHGSLLLALPLLAYVAARLAGPPDGPDAVAWTQGSLLALSLLAGVVFHEAAHLWTARGAGLRATRVLLLPVGGLTTYERPARDPRVAWRVALAGPLASLALGLLLLGLPGGTPLAWAAWVQLALGLGNLLPAHPLDGGRILRALLAPRVGEMRAAWLCARVGAAGALALCVWGILAGAWALLALAAFLHFGARHEEQAATLAHLLGRVRVADLMWRPRATLPADATLDAALERLLATAQRALPVLESGRPVGALLLADVERVDAADRAWTPVGMLARRDLPTFAPWDEGQEAAGRLGPDGLGLVCDAAGWLVGMVEGAHAARLLRT